MKKEVENTRPLRILSLGAGVQSTAMYYQSSLGILPRCDYAVFADTGCEPFAVYQNLARLIQWSIDNQGIPIVVASKGNLLVDMVSHYLGLSNSFPAIPAFVPKVNGGRAMLSRQCTGRYKIEVVNSVSRRLAGVAKYKHMSPCDLYLGISLDEVERIKHPLEVWKKHCYPYVGYTATRSGVERSSSEHVATRAELIAWLRAKNLVIPAKSSCTICPYLGSIDRKAYTESERDQLRVAEFVINETTGRSLGTRVYLSESLATVDELLASDDISPSLFNCSDSCNT